jgi:DNA-binding HxlR family transcriptional regulator
VEARNEMETRKTRANVIRKAIENIEQKLDDGKLTPTVADLVRLLQIEKDLEDEQPVEVRVTWVEPAEIESATRV